MSDKNQKEKINFQTKLMKVASYIALISSFFIILSVTFFGIIFYIVNYDTIHTSLNEFAEVENLEINMDLAINLFVFTTSIIYTGLAIFGIISSLKTLKILKKVETVEDFENYKTKFILYGLLYALITPWFVSSLLILLAIIINDNNNTSKPDKITAKIKLLNDSLENGEISEFTYKEELDKLIKKY